MVCVCSQVICGANKDNLPEVKGNNLAFLRNNLCQDPVENFFGCQRQRGGTALRVVDSFFRAPVKGNCCGSSSAAPVEHSHEPLPKRSTEERNIIQQM